MRINVSKAISLGEAMMAYARIYLENKKCRLKAGKLKNMYQCQQM
jgi:hypothetical protein